MAKDPIDQVGFNTAYWAGVNAKKKATYNRAKSNMQVMARQGATAEITYAVEEIQAAYTTPKIIAKGSWDNGTTVENSQEFSVSETTTQSFTYSFTEGIKIGAKFSAKIPFIGKAGIETTLDFSATQSKTETTTQQWEYKATVPVPPHSVVDVYFIISEGHFSIPFTAPVQVRGQVFIDYEDGTSETLDIDTLINRAGWSAWNFEANAAGTCDGIAGVEYKVKTVQDGGAEVILANKSLI